MNQMEVKRKRFSIISSIILLLNILVFTGILGEHGMGYLAGVLECFLLLILITVYTLPEAMAKLIRNRIQKGQNKNVMRVFKAALCLGIIYSVLGSLIILICSDILLGNLFKTVYGSFSLRLLLPAYILVVYVQVFRGFFQGMGTAIPTGVSQIIESIIFAGTGFLFCYLMGKYGNKVADLLRNDEFIASYSGAGISIGIIVAEFFSILFLIFVYQTNKRNLRRVSDKENFRMTEQISEIIRLLIVNMMPYTICIFCNRISILGGLSLYQRNITIDVADGIGVCGAFYGKYLSIILLIVMVIRLSVISIEGQIHAGLKRDEYKTVKEWISIGTHLIVIMCVFFTVITATLGSNFVNALFDDNAGNAGKMLERGSVLILFMSLGLFFSNILIFQGKIRKVILNMGCGVIISLVAMMLSTGIGHGGIDGIIIGLCIYWFVVMAGCGVICIKTIKWKIEWIYMFVIPGGCAALTGIITMLLNKALINIVGGCISVIICSIVGIFAYFILIMALRGIRKEELEVIPGGKFWYRIAETIHFL